MSYDPRDDAPTTPIRPNLTDEKILPVIGLYRSTFTGERIAIGFGELDYGSRGMVECFTLTRKDGYDLTDGFYDPEEDKVYDADYVAQYLADADYVRED